MICDTVSMTSEIHEDEQNMVPIRYLELDGEHKEIHSCYGDIIIIINAMADYAGLLDDYRRMYPERLNAFEAATYEYQANRCRKIQKSLEQQMGYDRDKAFEKCQRRRARQSDDDVGEEALALLARKNANEERKKEEARNPSEPVKEKAKSRGLEGQLSFL